MEPIEGRQNDELFVLKTKTHLSLHLYCPKLKLVIEIDGESHAERFESDQARQKKLEEHGLTVSRFRDR